MKNQAQKAVFSQIIRRITSGELVLPELPDVSIRILQLIETNSVSPGQLESALQFNPELESGLILIANSPIYGRGTVIFSFKEAVMRVGTQSAAFILLALSTEPVFRCQLESLSLNQRIRDLRQHSALVALIAAILAYRRGNLDPAKALLAGWVHDVGILVVLKFIDGFPSIKEDERRVDSTINSLRADVGLLVLDRWRLPKEFHQISREAENWLRRHDEEMDLIDVILIAQMHAFIEQPHSKFTPNLFKLPAFQKLGLDSQSPAMGLQIIQEAKAVMMELAALSNST